MHRGPTALRFVGRGRRRCRRFGPRKTAQRFRVPVSPQLARYSPKGASLRASRPLRSLVALAPHLPARSARRPRRGGVPLRCSGMNHYPPYCPHPPRCSVLRTTGHLYVLAGSFTTHRSTLSSHTIDTSCHPYHSLKLLIHNPPVPFPFFRVHTTAQ